MSRLFFFLLGTVFVSAAAFIDFDKDYPDARLLPNTWLMWIMERLYFTLQDVVVVTFQPIQIRQMSWAEGKRLKQILGLFMLQIFQQAQHMELVLGRLKIFMLL